MHICERHINTINRLKLCTGCGICVGVCIHGVLKIQCGKSIIVDSSSCMDCGVCEKCCPSYGYELADLSHSFYRMYEASSSDENLKKHCTSGGAVTQLLINAIHAGTVDKAAVVRACDNMTNGTSCEYYIASSVEEVMESSGTHYMMPSIANILKDIICSRTNTKYAIVGTPCILFGITQAEKYFSKIKESIALKIGLICGYTYECECIDGLCCLAGIQRKDIKRIVGWRQCGFPGSTVIETWGGEKISIPFHIEHCIDVTFFAHKKCLLCKDCFCDYGDIVCGDIGHGWKEKKTLLITRTSKGREFLEKSSSQLILTNISLEQLKRTPLRFMEIEKRSKVSIRINQFKEQFPIWTNNYNEVKLLPIRRLTAKYLNCYQKNIRSDKSKYLDYKTLFLNAGLKYYGGFENKKYIQCLFLLERAMQIILSQRSYFFKSIKLRLSAICKQKCSDNSIKIGIIGLGAWGSQYVGLLFKDIKYELISIYDKNLIHATAIAKRFHVHVQSPEEMVADRYIDTIFIITPNYLHEELIQLSLSHGKNVFVEKPLTNDLQSSVALVDASHKYQRLLYVAHSMKCSRGIKLLKDIIDSKKIGEIKQFSCVRSLHGIDISTRLSWRSDSHLAPMLPMLQLGIHLIDSLIYLFGNVRCVDCVIHDNCGITDSVLCLLEAGEIQGSLLTCYDTENTLELVIYGSKGKVMLNNTHLVLYENNSRSVLASDLDKEDLLQVEIDEYWQWRVKNVMPRNTASQALRTIELFESICNKAQTTGE